MQPAKPRPQKLEQQELQHWVAEQVTGRIRAHRTSHESGALDAAGIVLQPLKAEASFRQFYRIFLRPPQSAAGPEPELVSSGFVLMVSPPERENNAQFTALIPVFRNAGVRVPELFASHTESGWFLLEDLGDQDLEQAYSGPDREVAINAALVMLTRIQQIDDPLIPAYTSQRLRDELGIFRQWFVTELLDLALPEPVEGVFEKLISRIDTQEKRCIHRDYHCRNLLYTPGEEIGVVDFQDALKGAISYDVASLLHDCYFEFEADEIAHWREHFRRSIAPDLTPARFHTDVDYCAVQRQLKAIGIFTRLQRTRGLTSHLRHIDPVLGHLIGLCLRYPELVILGRWLESVRALAATRLERLL